MFRKTAMAVALGVILGFAGQTYAGHHMKSESKKAAKMDHTMDIVDMAAHTGTFNTLVAAVKAAGLVETLKGEGPFTVFAPTDDAFAKLPEGTIANLLKPENKDKLASILTYHVVAGDVRAADVVNLDSASTVQGSDVKVKTKYGKVMINDAKVTQADVVVDNGVIHVIDTVLLPE